MCDGGGDAMGLAGCIANMIWYLLNWVAGTQVLVLSMPSGCLKYFLI